MTAITNTEILFSAWQQISNTKKEISHQNFQAKIFWALAIITAVGLLVTYFCTPIGQLQTTFYLIECTLLNLSLIKIFWVYRKTKQLISEHLEIVKKLQSLTYCSSNDLWSCMQRSLAMSLIDFANVTTHGSKTLPPPEEISAYCRKINANSQTRIALIGDLDGQTRLLDRHIKMLKKENILTPDGKVQKNCLVFVMGNFIDKDPQQDSQTQNAQILFKLLELQGKSPKNFFLIRGDSDTLPPIHNCLPLGTQNKKIYQMWIRTLPEMVFVQHPQGMLTISHSAPEIGYNPRGFFHSKKASIHWVKHYDRRDFAERVAEIDKTVSQDFAKFLKGNIDHIPTYIDTTDTQKDTPYGRRGFFDTGPTVVCSIKGKFLRIANALFIAKEALLALQKRWAQEKSVAETDKTVSQDFAKFVNDNIGHIDATDTQKDTPYESSDTTPTVIRSIEGRFFRIADTLFIAKEALLALQSLWAKEEKVNMETFFIGNALEQSDAFYDQITPDGHAFDNNGSSLLLSQGSGATLRILNCAAHRLKSCNAALDNPVWTDHSY